MSTATVVVKSSVGFVDSGGTFRTGDGSTTRIVTPQVLKDLLGQNALVEDDGGTKASLSTAQGSNKDLTFEAKTAGTASNLVTVQYVEGAGTNTLSIRTAGTFPALKVIVTLKTIAGTGDSTADEVRDIVNQDVVASKYITAARKSGHDGTGKPGALAETALASGVDVVEDNDIVLCAVATLRKLMEK